MVYINEVCSSNIHAYLNDENGHPDYIELYNAGERDVPLENWKIADNRNNEEPWVFPAVIIPAKGFLLIEADGTERKTYPDEQRFSIRNFIMTGNGYIAEDTGLHASFTLPSDGGALSLSDAHNNLIDSIEVPELKYDTVYARISDGGGRFERLSPTPGETNAGAEEKVFPTLKAPVFSIESGFYDDAFRLTLYSPDGGEIRYSLDGSEPDKTSPLYEGALSIGDASENDNVYSEIRNTSVYLYDYYDKKDFSIPDEKVDKCTVLRAKVFSSDGRESETVTKSYFVGFDKKKMYENIQVISLVSEPDNLFGSEKGIYVLGDIGQADLKKKYSKSEEAAALIEEDPSLPLDGSVKIADVGFNRGSDGNYMQHGIEWEREADMTLFSADHESVTMQQAVGIRVKGNSSRQYPMKGFNIYARNAYSGNDAFNVPFFEGSAGEKRISLSAGGNDYYTLTKDAFVSRRINETGINIAAGRFGEPVYLFLDGEFWGTYMIAEREDEVFFEERYGVPRNNVVFIKEGEVGAGKNEDIHYYFTFLELFEDRDFSDDEQYAEFKEAVDIDSLMDYYAIRMFAEYGIDWPHLNMGYWRSREEGDSEYEDCKWRFVNFDNNNSLNLNKIDADMADVVLNGSKYFGADKLFTGLIKNKEFRRDFRERFTAVTEKVFSSEEAEQTYRDIADMLRIPVSESYKRWFGGNTGYDRDFFDRKCGDVLKFMDLRGGYINGMVEKLCR